MFAKCWCAGPGGGMPAQDFPSTTGRAAPCRQPDIIAVQCGGGTQCAQRRRSGKLAARVATRSYASARPCASVGGIGRCGDALGGRVCGDSGSAGQTLGKFGSRTGNGGHPDAGRAGNRRSVCHSGNGRAASGDSFCTDRKNEQGVGPPEHRRECRLAGNHPVRGLVPLRSFLVTAQLAAQRKSPQDLGARGICCRQPVAYR